ncbi:SUKH-4 family immunity protein [Streptomyces scabiei]|uniref:SUKH-4 family immunity protein n=3 Tax=Streptomyces scabiei TaxID=1930 RepID=UPI001FF0AA3D|nr:MULTISPECIES: SUKH-4 family immunity protein [Streptomyces]MDW8473363.1 SUKH-4 family immunity protein [Streptomyces scabiei]MDX2567382.1 SUKH-4 family immunity protein [Streptomyces scabiei]MDX2685769.1 SUKH-4 family immunity protein [Streptomyces scabiei]MDX2754057.1 SUKH-4 family immunity protein [Streptomyces scabiei]MDX2798187.1 SUKH-4 family immunity protein [Streptomyces scabiei]
MSTMTMGTMGLTDLNHLNDLHDMNDMNDLAVLTGRPATRSGLALDLPARLLDEEFGQSRVWRFEDFDFPATLTHEPTRRFLRDMGLPEDHGFFQLDTDIPLPTLAEYLADTGRPAGPGRLPDRAAHLIRLGHFVEGSSLVVDGTTGAVLNWSETESTLCPLDADISTLAFTLWLLHRERHEGTAAGCWVETLRNRACAGL